MRAESSIAAHAEGAVLAVDEAHKNSGLARHSSRLEKLLEYHFLASLGSELYRRGIEFSVLRDDVDGDGRDLLIEADGVFRHIQLKSVVRGGARSEITVNRRLARKRSAYIIWFTYDPESFVLGPFRWLGGPPGDYMPDLGERVARSTRANALGTKPFRADHRSVRRSRFEVLATVKELADRLFGARTKAGLAALRDHLQSRVTRDAHPLATAMRGGFWDEIPCDLTFEGSAELGMLIDGYALLGQLGHGDADAFLNEQWALAELDRQWRGCATELWITLFLEHRRQRFAGITEPDAKIELLNLLVRQLRTALLSEGHDQ